MAALGVSNSDNFGSGFYNPNRSNKFDVDISRLDKIKAKISVEDFGYLKGFAYSNEKIDEKDPRLVKIRGKLSEEDVRYLKRISDSKSLKGISGSTSFSNSKCFSNFTGGRGDPGNNNVIDICVIL